MSSESPSSLLAKEASRGQALVFVLRSAAESCEENTLGRLCFNTSAACDEITSAVSATVEVVSESARDVRARARGLCSSRDKRLESQCEEFDAIKGHLESFERQLCVDSGPVAIDVMEECVKALEREWSPLPRHSTVVLGNGGIISPSLLVRMSHVQAGVDAVHSVVSHPRWLTVDEVNVVTIASRDAFGDLVKCLKGEDVSATVSEGAGWAVRGTSVEGGHVTVTITPGTYALRTTTLVVSIGCAHVEVPLQLGSSVLGKHVHTIDTQNSDGNRGVAISPNGTRLAVCNESTSKITVYSLPDGALLAEFGSPGSGSGELDYPQKIVFSSRSNLLIADCANRRVQEVTLMGEHVRTIGEGVITGNVVGIAARVDILVVGSQGGIQPQVSVFDAISGDLIRSFGEKGKAKGQLHLCCGLRLTPDGNHILVTELHKRMSLFTLMGDFLRCIGEGTLKLPVDVDFASNGDILVADHHRICVFSPDGSTLLRAFGSEGDITGHFKCPTALAMHGDKLYVIDWMSHRVQVFK